MKRETKLKLAIATAALILGILIGDGSIWRYFEGERDTRRLELNETRNVLDLSLRLNEVYDEIVSLSIQFMKESDNFRRNGDAQSRKEMIDIHAKLSTLQNAYEIVESQLAKMMGRASKPIQLDFIPPGTPTDLHFVP